MSRLACLATVMFAMSGAVAFAQTPAASAPTTPPPNPESPGTPGAAKEEEQVILRADTVTDEKETNLIVAEGNVEVRVGKRVLKANKLIYDRAKQTMRAQGKVEITDESGAVEFAEQIETDEEFRNGFATRFSARIPPNGTATASSAVRTNGSRNALEQLVYTNCPLCEDESNPSWSIRARRAEQNTETQMITYQDAVLEIKGVPVLYLPYFAHPDPTSERRSGLMTPDGGVSSKIGVYYEQPYYWSISPSQDLTVSPMISTEVNPLVKVDYRKRFFSGFIQAESSFTHEKDFNSDGEKFGDDTWRSHLYANGLFNISEDWRWGFGIERQTDDLYDKRYDIDGEDDLRGLYSSQPRQLMTQVFLTGQTPDFYAESGAIVIQGLREGEDDARLPKVAPALFAQKAYDFGRNGRLTADVSGVALFRDIAQTLPDGTSTVDSARATTSLDWQAHYIVGPGLVVQPFVEGRGDFYALDDGTPAGDRNVSRFLGIAGGQVSYPFIRRGKSVDVIVEPVVMAAYGTPDANQDGIPNEDSLVFEADESNLFKPNAVSNYDLWEGGARATVGLSARARFGDGYEVATLVGRRFREEADPAFNALSNLGGEKSDYVGSIRATFGPFLNVGARARVDDAGSVNRIDVDAGTSIGPFSGSARYFKVSENAAGAEDEGVLARGQFKVTKNWSAIYEQQRNITAGRDLRLSLGVAYLDDCSFFLIAWEKNGSVDRTLRSYEGIKFTFALTGLGGVAPDAFD